MNQEDCRPPGHDAQASHAAAACLHRLEASSLKALCAAASPLGAAQAIADHLEQGAGDPCAWVVRPRPASPRQTPPRHAARPRADDAKALHHISAWPRWLPDTDPRAGQPVLYLLRCTSVGGLHSALSETKRRGIFFNAAETFPSRWTKGVQPALPLWLSSHADGIPYEPASGAEALALLRGALQTLHTRNAPGFFYFSAHDEQASADILPAASAQDACKGMYRVASPGGEPARIRLLGAGKALAHVSRAARLLQEDWGLACEVWSCPSYTRLARDSAEAACWNLLHPQSGGRTAHLQRCLASSTQPVIAVTGYARHIADQIGEFIHGRFVSIGADSYPAHVQAQEAQWLVIHALRVLAEQGLLPAHQAGTALARYGLVQAAGSWPQAAGPS